MRIAYDDSINLNRMTEKDIDHLGLVCFVEDMRNKLDHARENNGRHGWWMKDCTPIELSSMLIQAVYKGDPIDVANFCMMLHQRAAKIDQSTAHKLYLHMMDVGPAFATAHLMMEFIFPEKAHAPDVSTWDHIETRLAEFLSGSLPGSLVKKSLADEGWSKQTPPPENGAIVDLMCRDPHGAMITYERCVFIGQWHKPHRDFKKLVPLEASAEIVCWRHPK